MNKNTNLIWMFVLFYTWKILRKKETKNFGKINFKKYQKKKKK